MAEVKIAADSGGGSVGLVGPASTTSNAAVQLKLPVADGSANQHLKTDGSGQLGWATPGDNPNSSLAVTYQTSALSGSGNYDCDLPANCFQVDFNGWEISTSGSGNPGFYFGTPSILSSGHYHYTQSKFGAASAGTNAWAGNSANAIYIADHLGSNDGDGYYLSAKFKRTGSSNKWIYETMATEYESNVLQCVVGTCDTSSTITKIRFTPIGTGWDAGQFTWVAWSTA